MTYHIYILKSEKDNSIYIDYTADDIVQRLNAHNSGSIKHTQDKRPWSLMYSKNSKSFAQTKTIKNRIAKFMRPFGQLRNRIKERLNKDKIWDSIKIMNTAINKNV
jgi:predicted GIY-YIG superfamily endonuclease